jgi:hypothetical protein
MDISSNMIHQQNTWDVPFHQTSCKVVHSTLLLFNHATNRWGVVVSVSNISYSPSLNHLQLMDVILLVWVPDSAGIFQGHQASIYQMNDPTETTTSRHCALHHARPQYGKSRSILDRSRNGTPCLTVLHKNLNILRRNKVKFIYSASKNSVI